MNRMRKARRVSGALLSLLFVAIAQPALAEPAVQRAGNLKSFRVQEFERVIVPDTTESYVGRKLTLKTDQSEVLRVSIGYKFVAIIDGDVAATVGGLPQSIAAGDVFTRRQVSGGRLSELPETTIILCREGIERSFAQTMALATTLGLSQIAARYSSVVQLCAVDADRDGKIEKLFLGGAKQQQDLEFTEIEPTPYAYKEDFKVDGANVVFYAIKSIFGGSFIGAAIQFDGRTTPVTSMEFESSGKYTGIYPSVKIRKNAFPQNIKIGNADIVVNGIDDATGSIDIEIRKYFEIQKVKWYIAPTTIYVYY